jgi:hypothetical protein
MEDINNILLIYLFMISNTQLKPKIIKNFEDSVPIFRWIIILLILLRRQNGLIYFIMIIMLYQTLYLFDYLL